MVVKLRGDCVRADAGETGRGQQQRETQSFINTPGPVVVDEAPSEKVSAFNTLHRRGPPSLF
jgi:hypothetical protein